MEFPDPETADSDGFSRATPGATGLDADAVRDAVNYHLTHGTDRETVAYDYSNVEPWAESEGEMGYFLGPMPDSRGGPAGVVLKDGHLVAEWGDTGRVDHCFSVAKSFLSLVGGVGYERDLFALDAPVAETVDDGGFTDDHNSRIRWRHLFQQTSEWEGSLFDRPDTIDRNRSVGKTADLDKNQPRELREPGSFWEYNDVRINRLALSLLRVLGRPLPTVLSKRVMEPIGASGAWEWHGYHNSDVEVNGRTYRSVSGGGHWGGGLWSPTRDLARIGHLMLNAGAWEDMQLLPPEWVDHTMDPCEVNENYGFLWWLNTSQSLWPSAPESACAALGHGQNVIWIDPEHNLVVVLRWLGISEDRDDREDLPRQDAFFQRLLTGV